MQMRSIVSQILFFSAPRRHSPADLAEHGRRRNHIMGSLILITALWVCFVNPLRAQFTGSHAVGQGVPKAAGKSDLSGGAVGYDVNQFTGTLNVGYDLGSVATLSGLSFPLRLQYSSGAYMAFDPPQMSGVPYGEGWNLAEAYITVETYARQMPPDSLDHDLDARPLYTPTDAHAEGELWWANPEIVLPNGIGGRLVYKYPVKNGDGAVYMLETFDHYTEATFNGSVWVVRTEDGTEYEFGFAQLSYRNPSQMTAHLDKMEVQSILPKTEVVKWHLTEIRNYNHANAQIVQLGYYTLGAQNFYNELRQRNVYNWLVAHSTDTVHVSASNLHLYEANGYEIGDIVYLDGIAEFSLPTLYSDVFLKEVLARDADGTVISRAVLKYKSWRPEAALAFDPVKMDRGNFLLLSDTNVYRNDSLYSRKTVWWQGSDKAASTVHEPLGRRDPIAGLTSFTGWRRYQHPRAYQNKMIVWEPELNADNPYAAKYPLMPASPVLSAFRYYLMAQDVPALGQVPFTHSVLESPRLPDNLPPGDFYELRSTIQTPALADMNFDVNIVSGLSTDMPYYPAALKEKNTVVGGVTYHAKELPLDHFPIEGYYDRGLTVYSTFATIVKWNPAYQNPSSTIMTTRNVFRLPNLPAEFEGYHIQIGPAADNLPHYADANEHGYPEYYNNLRVAPKPPRDSLRLSVTPWFGTGAPLEPLYRTERFGILKGSSTSKGTSGMRWLYWHLPKGSYSGFDLHDWGAHQPTAVTVEHLSASLPAGAVFTYANLGFAHNPAEDAQLLNMELVRIAKNPWMLDSVIFYVQQGRYEDQVVTGAYHLEYQLEQVPVLNNVDRTNWYTLNPSWPAPLDYKTADGDTVYRNILQLVKIERIAVDTAGRITGAAGGTGTAPTTFFQYYKQNTATLYLPEEMLLREIRNELGARETVVYDLSSLDTMQVNHSPDGSLYDYNSKLMGGGGLKWLRIRVKEIHVENPNATSGENVTAYTYVNQRTLYGGYHKPADEFDGMNQRAESLWKRGFEKTIVTSPHPVTGLATGPRSETIHNVSTASATDKLLFGTVKRTVQYDALGNMLRESESTYAVDRAYFNGNRFEAAAKWSHGHVVRTPNNTLFNYENKFLLGTADEWRMDSYFLRVTDQSSKDRDPVTGNAVESATHITYYDWNFNREDTEGDYDEMWDDGTLHVNEFAMRPYYDFTGVWDSTGFLYWHEPSWQVATSKTTWPDRPGAFSSSKTYYLWDVWPYLLIGETDGKGTSLVGRNRPYYLANKYGIRNVPYEIRTTIYDGDPAATPFSRSTYLWYDVFNDVNPNLVINYDSTHYNDTCIVLGGGSGGGSGGGTGSGGGGHVIIGNCSPLGWVQDAAGGANRTGAVLGEVQAEMVDDPRWVRDSVFDSLGGRLQWFHLEVTNLVGLTPDDFLQIQSTGASTKTGPGTECPAGFAIGLPDSLGNPQILYWGSVLIDSASGTYLNLSGIEPPSQNYGSQWMYGDSLTRASLEKLASPVLLAAHKDCPAGCDLLHEVTDSALTTLYLGNLSGSDHSATIEAEATIDDNAGTGIKPPHRELFINVLSDQFYLRAVYEQADSVPDMNLYMGIGSEDSVNYTEYVTPHNIWDTVPIKESYYGQYYLFVFNPAYPVIRTYNVEERNDMGQVVEESDARHLHYLYEYDKGYFNAWWDTCGLAHIEYRKYNYGLPRSVTIEDYDHIHQTTVYDYWRNHRLRSIYTSNGELEEFKYEPYGRVNEIWKNGLLRFSYDYHQWQGILGSTWEQRTKENYIHTLTWDGTHTGALHGYAYSDPAGKGKQIIAAINSAPAGSPAQWQKSFTGQTDYDAWGRALRTHRPYAKTAQPDPYFDPLAPPTSFSEVQYENDPRSRVLASARTGNSIGLYKSTSEYKITTLENFFNECKLTASEFTQLFPKFSWTPGVPGKIYLSSPLALSAYHCYRSAGVDEDGKKVISYGDATGRNLATIGYTVTGSTAAGTEAVTLTITDTRGQVNKVIHPNKLESTSKSNFLGWVTESRTPDDGLTKYLYTQAGDLYAWQDENLRARNPSGTAGEGRYVAYHYEYDRMGRTLREEVAELHNFSSYMGQVPPFMTRDTLGSKHRSIYSIVDIPGEFVGERNSGLLHTVYFDAYSFPELSFSPATLERTHDYRYEYAQDAPATVTGAIPNVPDSHLHPNLFAIVKSDQTRLTGRLSLEISYQAGVPVEFTYYSYDAEGGLKWLGRQFRAEGLSPAAQGEAHLISYPEYDRQGRLLTTYTDIHANGVVDLQHHYEYDDYGRLSKAFIGRGTGSGARQLLADYKYDDATGSLLRTRYYIKGGLSSCSTLPVDSVFYTYDQQERLISRNSLFLDYGLYYDGNNPNVIPGGPTPLPGPSQVSYQQNRNGNLNGWQSTYKVGTTPTGPKVVNTVTGFDRRTVYGFKYDGLNRLTQSDASVWENSLTAPGGGPPLSSIDLTAPFGTSLSGNKNWFYGDERYEYDKAGNLTGLQRYYYRAPGSPPAVPGSRGDSWTYQYKAGTNQLLNLKEGGVTKAAFTYDRNGNVASDSRRELSGFYYNAQNLPVRFNKGVPSSSASSSVEYVYGSAGQRVKKRVIETHTKGSSTTTEVHEVFYLRDAGGTPVAIHDLSTGKWTMELYGAGLVAEAELNESEVPSGLLRSGDTSGVALSGLDSLKFFNTDHLGNVRVTYEPEFYFDLLLGCKVRYRIHSVLDYFPYGKHLRVWFSGDPEMWQTTMNERDPESGLDYRGARYYDSEYGRFLGVDPLGGAFTLWSPYNYVFGRPNSLIDPTGLSPDGGGKDGWGREHPDGGLTPGYKDEGGEIIYFMNKAYVQTITDWSTTDDLNALETLGRYIHLQSAGVALGVYDFGKGMVNFTFGWMADSKKWMADRNAQLQSLGNHNTYKKLLQSGTAPGLVWRGIEYYNSDHSGWQTVYDEGYFVGNEVVPMAATEGLGAAFGAVSVGAKIETSLAKTVVTEVGEVAVTPTSQVWKVGIYRALKGLEPGLDAHHVGQKSLMKKFIPTYQWKEGPSILVPAAGHTKSILGVGIVARTRGAGSFTNARQVLARDIFELRRVYPNIPRSSLQELIQLNKSMYPKGFIK